MSATLPIVTQAQVLDVLRRIEDPDLHQDIVSLGFITRNEVSNGAVAVTINLTTPACPVKEQMKGQAESLLRALPGVRSVAVEMTAVSNKPAGPARELAKGARHIIAVSSGKGGVGKSTVAVNLAVALAQTGASVGLLDCDVYGPDIPMMMGLAGPPLQQDRKLVPKERHGVKTMSIGYLLDEDKPVVWRGPMMHKLIEQFLGDVIWGDLDYLLVDMPPGTGDAQLSLAQLVNLIGAVLVTTPQAVSTFDVGKAIGMFNQVKVPILGLVENMSGFVVKGSVEGGVAGQTIRFDAGGVDQFATLGPGGTFETVMEVFGSGGADRLATKHGFPMLGRVPLNPIVRVGGDGGLPVTVSHPNSPISLAFREIAGRMAQRVAIQAHKSLPILQ
ncbi:MAG TPA: Mrp/NBP35 family ATP-binding protein [Planctomycetota bacterium]|nr:Mrp/NBP35 family ATP-binding protein [Planctomycetota bacterium]